MTKEKDNKLTFEIFSKYRGALMGLAIISIILFHYTEDCSSINYNFTGFVFLFKKYIGSAGVDIFLMLSGLGLYYSFKKNNNLAQFYKKRYIKILLPYVLICLPALIWRYMIFKNVGILEVIRHFSFLTFFTDGYVWFWYILMIGFCYYIFPYIFKVFDEEQSEISEQMRLLLLCSVVVILGLLLINYKKDMFYRINIALLRLPAFFIGVYLGKQAYNKKPISTFSALSFIILSILLYFVMYTGNIMINRFVLTLLLADIFFVLIILFDKFKNSKIMTIIVKGLSKIGEYTLELYLLHVIGRTVFKAYGWNTAYIQNELLMILAAACLSVIMKKVIDLIEKKLIKLEKN